MKTLTLEERLQVLHVRYCTLVILLASVDVLGPLATDAHLPSLPTMTADLHTSAEWIQFSVLSYSLVLAVSCLFGGYLSDRFGRRIVTIFGLLLFIVGGIGCTFAPSILVLNASRIVQGFGGGMSSITTQCVARDVFTAKERMKILGILGSLRPFAIAVAPMFGGWIASMSSYSWRMVFGVTSVAAMLVLMFTILCLPETKHKFFSATAHLQQSQSQSQPAYSVGYILRLVCKDCILLSIAGMTACRMVAVFVFLNEFPYVAHHLYGYDERVAGLLLGCGAIFLVVGSCVSILLDHWGMHALNIMRCAAVCTLLAAVALIGAPVLHHWQKVKSEQITLYDLYTDNEWYFIVFPFCALTVSQGMNGPPSNVIAMEPYPHVAGSIGSMLVFCKLILPALFMIVLTQVVSSSTETYAAIVIYITMAAMALCCFVLMFGGPCLMKRNVKQRMDGHNQNQKQQINALLLEQEPE